MSLTTVAELRATLGVGTLYTDPTLQSVCDAADAVLIPMLWAKKGFAIAHSKTTTTATLYFNEAPDFIVGDSVVITNSLFRKPLSPNVLTSPISLILPNISIIYIRFNFIHNFNELIISQLNF